jgi:hypothetical protein
MSKQLNQYLPIEGGWQISISGNPVSKPFSPHLPIGTICDRPAENDDFKTIEVIQHPDDPRRHHRPLYPPADLSLVFTPDQMEKIRYVPFRPIVVAYNAPRFVFDYHSLGGVLGHLRLGLVAKDTPGKWLDEWSDLDVRYIDGRMEYHLQDPAFPGLELILQAIASPQSIGLMLHYELIGNSAGLTLVAGFGGASTFFDIHTCEEEFDYSPKGCAKNEIRWDNGRFSLVRPFDSTDVFWNAPWYIIPVVHRLPEYRAVIQGGCSTPARTGFGSPEKLLDSPANFVTTAQWTGNPLKHDCLAVMSIPVERDDPKGFIIVGMGGNILDAIKNPKQAWQAGLAKHAAIAQRITTQTPDPHLDSAMRMVAFGTDGIWGDCAYMHGGWSWRTACLGWRGLYGPNCYGWTDRVKTNVISHIEHGLIKDGDDRGAITHNLESQPTGTSYNMDEVFLDQVRHYFNYTNDLEWMREIFPILKGIVEWENRRLRPESEYLYESCLNTWISDSHWYIRGQCTQASAYMLMAHAFLADLAERLGEDPAPYAQAAAHIRRAMQQKLWMSREGVFAEYLDTLGHRLLHPEPELPTIYHAAEFDVADPLQIYQMLHWAHTHLRSEISMGGGKCFWNSNWFPNKGRSYTHSTYDVVYAEELNFALTHFLVGRSADAYDLIRYCIAGIYNGLTPGGLCCQSRADGRQRHNDEFADSISMWGRTIAEGLFGIAPCLPDGVIHLCPQFPADWPKAAITTPLFSYEWSRENGEESICWKSPVKTSIHLRLPVKASQIKNVTFNGNPIAWAAEPGVNLTWLKVNTPVVGAGTIGISYLPVRVSDRPEITVHPGEEFVLNISEVGAKDFLDPQGLLTKTAFDGKVLRGQVKDSPGPGLLFLSAGTASCPMWVPVKLRVEPVDPIPAKLWKVPSTVRGDLAPWRPVDLNPVFNFSLTEVMDHFLAHGKSPALPYSQVGFQYRNEHFKNRARLLPSDAAWRAKVGPDQIAWTADGIPFKTNSVGANIAVVSLSEGFPAKITVPINKTGDTLYLMISGITFPAQSHVTNLRLSLRYQHGKTEVVDLVNPQTVGDGWGSWLGRVHDTAANGFENIAGRYGPAGSCEVKDLTQPVAVDTEAHLLAIPMNSQLVLGELTFEAIANDVVFGLMGVSILKS